MKPMTKEETEKGNYKYQGILQRGMNEEDRAQALAYMKSLGYNFSSTPSTGSNNNRKFADHITKGIATPSRCRLGCRLSGFKSQDEARNVNFTTPSAGNNEYQGILQRGKRMVKNTKAARAASYLKSLGYVVSIPPSAGSNNRKAADRRTKGIATPSGSTRSGFKSQDEARNVNFTTPSAGNNKYQGILKRGMSKEENAKATEYLKSLGYVDSIPPSAGSNNKKAADGKNKQTATPSDSGSKIHKCTTEIIILE